MAGQEPCEIFIELLQKVVLAQREIREKLLYQNALLTAILSCCNRENREVNNSNPLSPTIYVPSVSSGPIHLPPREITSRSFCGQISAQN